LNSLLILLNFLLPLFALLGFLLESFFFAFLSFNTCIFSFICYLYIMNDIAFEIETAAECLFESGEENFEEVAKEIANRYPGVSWSSIRLSLEYQVDDLKKLEEIEDLAYGESVMVK
jgi:hypothetical protein